MVKKKKEKKYIWKIMGIKQRLNKINLNLEALDEVKHIVVIRAVTN